MPEYEESEATMIVNKINEEFSEMFARFIQGSVEATDFDDLWSGNRGVMFKGAELKITWPLLSTKNYLLTEEDRVLKILFSDDYSNYYDGCEIIFSFSNPSELVLHLETIFGDVSEVSFQDENLQGGLKALLCKMKNL